MENFNKIKQLLSDAEGDAKKFYDQNNTAAGTRLRKALQSIKTAAQDARNEITELKAERTK